jgi:hypothetical protein
MNPFNRFTLCPRPKMFSECGTAQSATNRVFSESHTTGLGVPPSVAFCLIKSPVAQLSVSLVFGQVVRENAVSSRRGVRVGEEQLRRAPVSSWQTGSGT